MSFTTYFIDYLRAVDAKMNFQKRKIFCGPVCCSSSNIIWVSKSRRMR